MTGKKRHHEARTGPVHRAGHDGHGERRYIIMVRQISGLARPAGINMITTDCSTRQDDMPYIEANVPHHGYKPVEGIPAEPAELVTIIGQSPA
ncbi:hypothetical protein HNQ59_003401 [Chitinivorax tropicus]|uniref:Uncharacterized protein n=1 Tax=Chitinivorax tropicus TaxID=714531 RepID=A0A840MN70_9PROT|nr:hypothetical protein [Chitinivorax tropicus]MBB5020088.1 hypothetical protein [Chitinivorax tropicus]